MTSRECCFGLRDSARSTIMDTARGFALVRGRHLLRPAENPAAGCRSRRRAIQSRSPKRPESVRPDGSIIVKREVSLLAGRQSFSHKGHAGPTSRRSEQRVRLPTQFCDERPCGAPCRLPRSWRRAGSSARSGRHPVSRFDATLDRRQVRCKQRLGGRGTGPSRACGVRLASWATACFPGRTRLSTLAVAPPAPAGGGDRRAPGPPGAQGSRAGLSRWDSIRSARAE
jgi:hypothetical protein